MPRASRPRRCAGYSEAKLESAWRNATNQEIAASIVGHIRRAALGEALIPFEQRVREAMQRIYGLKRLDALLGHHLDEVLEALNDALWEAS